MKFFKSKKEKEEEAEWDTIEKAANEIIKYNTKQDIKELRRKRRSKAKSKRKTKGCGCEK